MLDTGVSPTKVAMKLSIETNAVKAAAVAAKSPVALEAPRCDTHAMTDRDVYERLGELERLVRHLYKQTGVPMPDLAALATTEVSDNVRQLVASGNKIGAIKAYRTEANVDLATANTIIDSLYGG